MLGMHVLALCTFFYVLLVSVNCAKDPHVIIIGAGAAGISAATRLYENGIKNITVLEAESRIGGRIYSLKFHNTYIDLGAQWCHGEKDNVVYNLAKNLNILKADNFTTKLYHSKLKRLDEDLSLKLTGIMESLYWNDYVSQQKSLVEALTESYKNEIDKIWKHDKDKHMIAEDALDFFHKGMLLHDGAFTWFNSSASGNYEICEGSQSLSWRGFGFKTILDVLMHKFSKSNNEIPLEDQTLLNKEVIQIKWDDPLQHNKVVVKCADGTSYEADHVILTVSLGVLKEQYETLFRPNLPNNKVTAIHSLGIDAVSKIFFHFPTKWWDDSLESVGWIWDQKDLEKSAEVFPEGPKKGGRSWITAITGIMIVSKSPNLLSVWVCGDFVPEIEKTPDATIISGVMYLLHNFIGQSYPNLTSPDRIMRSNWYSNPHFRGTYSYETVETQKFNQSLHEVLSNPLNSEDEKPVLLFAGEATNTNHYSTVHGAIETGFREADRLINIYK